MSISKLHDQILNNTINELRTEGYKAFNLERKCPDGIAIKDGKIYAIEILGMQYVRGKGHKKKWTYRSKKQIYHMFDEVIIKTFVYPKKD